MTCRGLLLLSVAVVASGSAFAQPWSPDLHSARIARHAAANGIPPALVRRVIQIESKGNPTLVSKGNYGLMQIRLGTAKAMGYQGDAEGLLDPDVNMTYAVKYLAGAYRAANGNEDGAVRNYQRGYYVSAKAKGFSPYERPPALAAAASAPAAIERPMPPAPRSPIAALLTPAETPAEIVRARMPKPQAPAADIVDPNRNFDTKPALPPTTTAMAPSDQRAVQPRPVRIEQQFAARPASVRSDATSAETASPAAATAIAVPLPRPAPQRPAAPVLAAIEPAAPAPDVQKPGLPKSEPVAPSAKRASRPEQKPKLLAVAPATPPGAAPAEPAARHAAPSGESASLWSAFKSEIAAARGTTAEPVKTAASPAAEAAPVAATHRKKSAKESEPFDLLSYVKKKIAPDTKPEKK
jgi:hypothetical protein